MRCLYVGNVGPGSPDFSTENDICRSFEELGWEVDPCSEREFMAICDDPAQGPAFLERAQSADLVMHTMTQGLYPNPDAVTELWRLLKEAGVPTASYHLDRFYGLGSPKDSGPQRCDLPRLHPMFKVEHVFTADGDHQAEFERDGVNHHFLRPGVRTEHAHDSEAYPPWVGQWDVAFIGSSGYHPEHSHRGEMVAQLREWYGPRFLHIGPGTSDSVTLDTGEVVDRLRGHNLNRLYSSIPVTVGDSCLLTRNGYYTSDRPYECYGRGGFLIHPGVYGLVEAIGDYPGHGWNLGDWDSLHNEIERYLTDPVDRENTRQRLAAEVRQNHTYTVRVRQMLDVIGIA